MGDIKKYEKYKKHGAYHWYWLVHKRSYRLNVELFKRWVQEKKVLDIGAGDGVISKLLGIEGIDNDPEGVRLAKEKGANVELGDAYKLPYADEQFDSAIMSDTVEHFSDTNMPLSEVRRVIKKYFYVNVPIEDRIVEPDHYHCWAPVQFIQQVESIGFVLEEFLPPQNKRYYFKFRKV